MLGGDCKKMNAQEMNDLKVKIKYMYQKRAGFGSMNQYAGSS